MSHAAPESAYQSPNRAQWGNNALVQACQVCDRVPARPKVSFVRQNLLRRLHAQSWWCRRWCIFWLARSQEAIVTDRVKCSRSLEEDVKAENKRGVLRSAAPVSRGCSNRNFGAGLSAGESRQVGMNCIGSSRDGIDCGPRF